MRHRSSGQIQHASVISTSAATEISFVYATRLQSNTFQSGWKRAFGYKYPGRLRYGTFADKKEFEALFQEAAEQGALKRARAHYEAEGILTPVVVTDDTSSVTDVVTPGYKRKIARGQIINNPFSKISRKYNYDIVAQRGSPIYDIASRSFGYLHTGSRQIYRAKYTIKLTNVIESGIGCVPGFHTYFKKLCESPGANLGPNALRQANSDLRSADLDAIVNVAELSDTIKTIATGARRIGSLARSIKRGQFFKAAPKAWKRYRKDLRNGKAVKPADYATDAWLEARYAWRPIMYDVNGALKLLNGDKSASRRMTFRGYDESSSNTEIDVLYVDEKTGFSYSGKVTKSQQISSRAGIIGEARFNSSYPKSLGLFNVIDAGWDLVPYSFVVDWFIDISWLLSKIQPSAVYKTLTSWYTNTIETTVVGDITVTSPDGTSKVIPVGMTSTQKVRKPSPDVSFIAIDINLDFLKLIDLGALFRAR